MAAEKTCLVIGAGAGIGGSVGKKFAAEGYHAALCRRSDIDGLNTMVSGLQEAGMSASGHLLNAYSRDCEMGAGIRRSLAAPCVFVPDPHDSR